jgi:hypothetical protein
MTASRLVRRLTSETSRGLRRFAGRYAHIANDVDRVENIQCRPDYGGWQPHGPSTIEHGGNAAAEPDRIPTAKHPNAPPSVIPPSAEQPACRCLTPRRYRRMRLVTPNSENDLRRSPRTRRSIDEFVESRCERQRSREWQRSALPSQAFEPTRLQRNADNDSSSTRHGTSTTRHRKPFANIDEHNQYV